MSCNNEDEAFQSEDASVSITPAFFDGKMMSFKNDESFISEYSDLSKLSKDKLEKWISSKKAIVLLNAFDNLSELEFEDGVIPEAGLVYSDALKAVLNSESKVKIGDKILWLNERNFYLLSENEVNKSLKELNDIKANLKVYGRLLSVGDSDKNFASKNVIPNENRTKTFVSGEMSVSGSRLRHVLDLFNETIYLNDVLKSSKMYLRSRLQYRSCSTWRCTWKEAGNVRSLSTGLFCGSCGNGTLAPWSMADINVTGISGTQTYLLGEWTLVSPLADLYPNFVVSGSVTCYVAGGATSVDISWY
jgi:hypothetical protein